MFITENTLSTIETLANSQVKLTFYHKKNIVFTKLYKSFRSAKIAQTKLFAKYVY